MIYRILADAVLILHLGFILFVVLGGLLVLRWPKLAWVHLPVAAYGVLIELIGWICPLTPLENRLRRLGGGAGFEGGFVEHYLVPIIYPHTLTHELQIALGLGVLLINGIVYSVVLRRRRHDRETPGPEDT